MANADTVVTTRNLEDIYYPEDAPEQEDRYVRVVAQFCDQNAGQLPEFIARSPGRVNIIGEHIDYSLYPVLPMAIKDDVLVLVSARADDTTGLSPPTEDEFYVEVSNTEGDKYPPKRMTFSQHHVSSEPFAAHHWSNYFLAGLRGAMQKLIQKHGPGKSYKSMRVLVNGTVPAAGGLSSSAALVVASALAVLRAQGEDVIERRALTELAIVSERSVGVISGGMDQSASVMSQRGAALFVEFYPELLARPVYFPETKPALKFVIAQTFVKAEKQVSAAFGYNLRVVECTLAALVLNALVNPPGTKLMVDASPLQQSLRGFHEAYFGLKKRDVEPKTESSDKALIRQFQELRQLVEDKLHQQPYTLEEVAQILGTDVATLKANQLQGYPTEAKGFKLRDRALHVWSEAQRVVSFMELLKNPPADHEEEKYNAELGKLLLESQDSCRDSFDCSVSEIDQLVQLGREGGGSYGGRLTGAGWGGCTIHLVAEDKVARVKESMIKGYYSGLDKDKAVLDTAIVVTRPGTGSTIYEPSDILRTKVGALKSL
ncbi:ribosomal protein S5 domain 2-type protein [Podospora conica]|nr:ribosomal protein S5 domain 2-type protein [Schizothecium conicum]